MKAPAKNVALLALAMAAIVFALYLRNLLGDSTFIGRDHLTLVTPARSYLGTTLAEGRIPQWWNGVGMGTAFAANPMHGAFYPLAWLSALSPGSLGSDLVIVVHVFLLGLGTACFSRTLGASLQGAAVAGAVAMTSGYTASMVVNGVPLLTLAWIPWVGWAMERLVRLSTPWLQRIQPLLLVAATLCLVLLSGDPAGALTAGLLATCIALTHSKTRARALGALTACTVLATLMAAIVLVPAFSLLAQSERSGGMSMSEASVWSMHPLRILEWIWPQFLGDATSPQLNLARSVANSSTDSFFAPAWSISVFVGVPVLLLVLLSRKRALGWASLVFVVLALGSYTPLYGVYRWAFLPEQLIRYPERHLAGAMVLWAALAGVGLSNVLSSGLAPRTLRNCAIVALTFLGLVLLSALFSDHAVEFLAGDAQSLGIDTKAAVQRSVSGGIGVALATCLFVAALWLRHRNLVPKLALLLLVSALLWPLASESMHSQPVLEREVVQQIPNILAPIAQQPASQVEVPRLYRHRSFNPVLGEITAPVRLASYFHTAVANTATAFGFAYVPGYDPTLSSNLKETWELASRFGLRMLQLYDIEYAFLPKQAAQAGQMELVHSSVLDPRLVLARQTHRRPRAFVAQHWSFAASRQQVHQRLFAAEHALNSVTIEGSGSASTLASSSALLPCILHSEIPEKVDLECSSEAGGFAVLLDAWAPGWSAEVDGIAAQIERADGLVRAVRIPAGTHRVTFRFQTPGLNMGLAISISAWLLFAIALFADGRRRRLHGEIEP